MIIQVTLREEQLTSNALTQLRQLGDKVTVKKVRGATIEFETADEVWQMIGWQVNNTFTAITTTEEEL
jgi:hypothetical protein